MKKTINALFAGCIMALTGWMLVNIFQNIDEQNLEFGFDFLFTRSGFDMGDAWILHNSHQTYMHAILSGLYNTLLLALACIVLSTSLGTVFAILSTTHAPWLTTISRIYINIFRNIPLLVQILFFYTLMVHWLPPVRESFQIGDIYLSNSKGSRSRMKRGCSACAAKLIGLWDQLVELGPRTCTSNAMKRVEAEQHDLLVPYIDRFIEQIGALDQASAP